MAGTPIQVELKAREGKPELIQEAVREADPMSWDGLEIKQAMVNFYSLLRDGPS